MGRHPVTRRLAWHLDNIAAYLVCRAIEHMLKGR
jgi:hypothetical protein